MKLKVAAVSSKNLFGNIEENLKNHHKWIDRALETGAKFIGFPEGSLTGYIRNPDVALPLKSRPVEEVAELAARHKIYIAVGLNEKKGTRVYNTCVVFGTRGMVGFMRKINCIVAESSFFTSGRDVPVLDVGGCRMSIATCADASFFEMFRIPSLKGAQVLFAPHANTLKIMGNSPAGWKRWRKPTWRRFLVDCPLFVVGCNNAGLFEHPAKGEEEYAFCGGAMIMAPDGHILAQSSVRRKTECMVVAELDTDKFPSIPHSDCLRPEILYKCGGGWVHGYRRDDGRS